jgi:hypothetical protein
MIVNSLLSMKPVCKKKILVGAEFLRRVCILRISTHVQVRRCPHDGVVYGYVDPAHLAECACLKKKSLIANRPGVSKRRTQGALVLSSLSAARSSIGCASA